MWAKHNDEKIILLLYRISKIKHTMQLGLHKSPVDAYKQIAKLKREVLKLGGNPRSTIYID